MNIPTVAQTMTSTLLSGSDITFSIRNDPACAWTLNSTYDAFTFAHATTSACATFARVESHLMNGTNAQGQHQVNTNTYGPTTGTGPFEFSPVFRFTIALPGDTYTLDWLLIDPDSVKCCGPI